MTLRKKYLKIIFFSFVVFIFSAVIFSFGITPIKAAVSNGLELDYPEILGNKPTTIATDLPSYVKYVFDFAIVFAGLIAFGSLIYGGFIYFTSTGDPMKIKSAKEQMTASFTGLLILLSSYLILATINPNLVSLLSKIKPKSCTTPATAAKICSWLVVSYCLICNCFFSKEASVGFRKPFGILAQPIIPKHKNTTNSFENLQFFFILLSFKSWKNDMQNHELFYPRQIL